MEYDIERRGHADEIAPAASLLDLKQQTLVLGVHLLRVKPLGIQPAFYVGDQLGRVRRWAYVAASFRTRGCLKVLFRRRSGNQSSRVVGFHLRGPTGRTETGACRRLCAALLAVFRCRGGTIAIGSI